MRYIGGSVIPDLSKEQGNNSCHNQPGGLGKVSTPDILNYIGTAQLLAGVVAGLRFDMNKSDIEQKLEQRAREKGSQGPVRTYNAWQLFFLDRLHRLSLLNKEAQEGNLNDFQVKLVRYGIFSTLLDCTAAGVEEEAHEIIEMPSDEARA